MTNSLPSIMELKLALKRQGHNYKIIDIGGKVGKTLDLLDVDRGIHTYGKLVESITEGEVKHWPQLSHENLAPLIDIVFIHDKLNIILTIDCSVTLKEIVHEEDFVHDPKCLERKKSYARGILSGLSYLHGKSLCLMNLSDRNVVICKLNDQAIISDFSCLITCERRTAKSELSVPELYRAPETDKNYFEAKAAEIWASGVLMLDIFLAHMVPWAIVGHKPSKVVKMVEFLSLDLLKSANIGSDISTWDLMKYKTFLKCFFKEVPSARVTAKNASIASFLRPRLHEGILNSGTLETPKQLALESSRKRKDIPFSTRNVNLPVSSHIVSKEDKIPDLETNQPNSNGRRYLALRPQAEKRSSPTDSPSDITKFKSLSDIRDFSMPSAFSSKTQIAKHLKSDVCLDRLFNEIVFAEGQRVSSDEARPTPTAEDIPVKEDLQERIRIQPQTAPKRIATSAIEGEIRRDIDVSQKTNEGAQRNPPLQLISKKIILLSQHLRSVRNFPVLHISHEFEAKQRELLKEYRNFLHREKIKLAADLIKKRRLTISQNKTAPEVQCPVKPIRRSVDGKSCRPCDSKLILNPQPTDTIPRVQYRFPNKETAVGNNTRLCGTKPKAERQPACNEKFIANRERISNDNQLKNTRINPNTRTCVNSCCHEACMPHAESEQEPIRLTATQEEFPAVLKEFGSKDTPIQRKTTKPVKKENVDKSKLWLLKQKVEELEILPKTMLKTRPTYKGENAKSFPRQKEKPDKSNLRPCKEKVEKLEILPEIMLKTGPNYKGENAKSLKRQKENPDKSVKSGRTKLPEDCPKQAKGSSFFFALCPGGRVDEEAKPDD